MTNQTVIQLHQSAKSVSVAETDAARYLIALRLKAGEFEVVGERERATKRLSAIRHAVTSAAVELAPIGFSVESSRKILTIIEVLQVRGFEKEIGEEAQTKIDLDWIEDLSEFPEWAINLAAKRWRRVTGRNRAPYASGELMGMVAKEISDLRKIQKKGQRVLKGLSS